MAGVDNVLTVLANRGAGGTMIKTKKGEVAYWVIGTAAVALATLQFAVVVTN